MRRIADRRPEALAELYDRFAPMLLAIARRLLRSDAEAEEVLQEVFLQVWHQAIRYDARRSSVATWLVLLTRSRAIDRARRRRVREQAVEVAEQDPGRPTHTSPEGPAAVWYEERRQRVRAALDRLPAEQRAVLEMAFFEGRTQREIAESTGLPLGTVKTRTLLAMKKLRAMLQDELEGLL